MNTHDEILLARRLWIKILETEELIRDHYLQLTEEALAMDNHMTSRRQNNLKSLSI